MKTNEELKKATNLNIQETAPDGGWGVLYKAGKPFGSVIWSNGGGWEHVSVCPYKHSYTPSWDDMCELKDKFFREDETVVQFHPAKSEYVNNMPNCLHLWRPTEETMPTPPSIFVGVKPGMSREEIRKEYQGIEWGGIRETAMRSALKYAGVDVDALYDEFGGRRFTIAYKENGNG